jgi:hypothetical protein
VAVITAGLHMLIGFGVLAEPVFVYGALPLSAFAVPAIVAPYVVLVLGVTWFLAALGSTFATSRRSSVSTMLLLFLSPVFYPGERCRKPIAAGSRSTADAAARSDPRRADLGRWPDWRAASTRLSRSRLLRRLLVVPEELQGLCRRSLTVDRFTNARLHRNATSSPRTRGPRRSSEDAGSRPPARGDIPR